MILTQCCLFLLFLPECRELAKDFVVAGTASESLYGACEAMFKPDMVCHYLSQISFINEISIDLQVECMCFCSYMESLYNVAARTYTQNNGTFSFKKQNNFNHGDRVVSLR